MSSNVHGLVNVKKYDVFWRLLAVCVEKTCCYQRFTTRMQLFPRIFTKLPFDYRAKNGIYSYIHRCFTPLAIWTSINMFIIHILCFGEEKKKTAILFHLSALRVFVFVGRQCSSRHLCPCFIAKHMVFTGSENKF